MSTDSSSDVGMKNDEFESSENNDLRNLSEADYWRFWKQWFHNAQQTNDRDAHIFSHGVLLVEPGYEHFMSEAEHGVI